MVDSNEKTVLIVDDEPDVRLFLQTVLEDAGFHVMVASHGKQALERMTEKKPHAISLDLVMPKMSGLKFYRYIQKNKDRKDIPIVVVTAHGRDEFASKELKELQKDAEKREGLYFLEKPVKPAQYVKIVREATGLGEAGPGVESQEELREQVQKRLRGANAEELQEVLNLLSGRTDRI